MKNILFVFLGGGIGSILRYLFAKFLNPIWENFFLGTFLTNAAACFLLGWLTGITLKSNQDDVIKYFLMIGLCGGFSTFSTFAMEFVKVNNSGLVFQSMLYVLLSLVAGILAVVLGVSIGQR